MPALIDVTDRLVIRELDMSDLRGYQHIIDSCAEGIAPDLVGLPAEEFAAWHEAYIRYQYGFYGYGIWGIFLKGSVVDYDSYLRTDEGPLIGIVGLVNGSASRVGEISYAIEAPYRHKGYALEAARAAIEYGKECGFTAFEAEISQTNEASLRLARKLGIDIIYKPWRTSDA